MGSATSGYEVASKERSAQSERCGGRKRTSMFSWQRNAQAAKTAMMIQKLQPAKPRKDNFEVIVEGVT